MGAALSPEARFAKLATYYKDIDLSLRQDYWDLLRDLGDPHLRLPPVIHVAGTNGKGSTIAFLRAMLEAAGKTVHVYTSPHLVEFNERIRLAGNLISDSALHDLAARCEHYVGQRKLTQFEIITAAAFFALANTPADVCLIEVGMGGRLDSTNVIPKAAATVVTRISYDHRLFLGDTLTAIAREKAGIFKENTPAILGPQESAEAVGAICAHAAEIGAELFAHDKGWRYALTGDGFSFLSTHFTHSFPKPALLGAHQYANAATAIATLVQLPHWHVKADAMTRGLREVEWPARLQRLTSGPLVDLLPKDWELWLDGGHNDSAGEALARQAEEWHEEDGKPLYLVYGMVNTKRPEEFLQPLQKHLAGVASIPIPEEALSLPAEATAEAARGVGLASVHAASSAEEAIAALAKNTGAAGRILISGSLYLAGHVLRNHG